MLGVAGLRVSDLECSSPQVWLWSGVTTFQGHRV